MEISGKGILLRIYIGEKDKYHGGLLFEKIVLKLREMGIAGCTVLRGVEGFGAGSRIIHKADLLRLSEDLPILIEVVDIPERIDSAIHIVLEMVEEAGCGILMTKETVEIISYKP
ncbi:MAG: DUF190 domain-containing protein [Calditrichia bacterium]